METCDYINSPIDSSDINYIEPDIKKTNTTNTTEPNFEIQQLLLYRVRDNRNTYVIISKSNTLNVQYLFKGKLVINLGTLIPDENHKLNTTGLSLLFKDTDYIKIDKINTSVSNSSLQTLMVSILTGKSKYKFVQVGDSKSNTYVLKK